MVCSLRYFRARCSVGAFISLSFPDLNTSVFPKSILMILQLVPHSTSRQKSTFKTNYFSFHSHLAPFLFRVLVSCILFTFASDLKKMSSGIFSVLLFSQLIMLKSDHYNNPRSEFRSEFHCTKTDQYNKLLTFFILFYLVAECQSIVPNCAKCLDSFRCRKCRSDLHAFFNKSGMVCVRNCPRGLVAANSSDFGKYCKKPLVGKKYIPQFSARDVRKRLKSHFNHRKNYTLKLQV